MPRTITDPLGPPMTAADPISGGTITVRTDRSLDELDAVLVVTGVDDQGEAMFEPACFVQLTRWEARALLAKVGGDQDLEEVEDRLRRLLAHEGEAR
jgi:hypothetical protein